MNPFKKLKQRREEKERHRKMVEDLIEKELQAASKCATAEIAGAYIDNAEKLIRLRDQEEELKLAKARLTVDKVRIGSDIATCGAKLWAQGRAIQQADAMTKAGLIDTTEYGKPTRRDLFKLW